MQQLGGLCGCQRTGAAHCRDCRSLSSRARRIGWLRRASQSTMRRYTRSWPRRVEGATSKIAKAAVPKQPRILIQRWPAATRQPGTRRTMLSVSTLAIMVVYRPLNTRDGRGLAHAPLFKCVLSVAQAHAVHVVRVNVLMFYVYRPVLHGTCRHQICTVV